MSADDDDRMVDQAIDLKERCRRAVAFLQRARELPELTPAQIDRIERRLQQPRAIRRPLLSPTLAALLILLLAGGAVAMVGRDFTWLPGLGRWLGTRTATHAAPATHGGARAPHSPLPAQSPVPAERESTEPAPRDTPPATAARAVPATDVSAPATAHERGQEARVALAPIHHDQARGAAAETPAAPETPAIEPGPTPAEPALVRAPPPATEPAALALAPAPAAAPVLATADPAPPRSSAPLSARATTDSAIVAESRSFASALERWHREHDAAAALQALDAHERRFPSGQILIEARLLRAEILLAGGRVGDALALLDQLAIAGLPRARELRTVRGELRIKLGRCADGKADLQAVLGAGTTDPLAQRARRAMATCP